MSSTGRAASTLGSCSCAAPAGSGKSSRPLRSRLSLVFSDFGRPASNACSSLQQRLYLFDRVCLVGRLVVPVAAHPREPQRNATGVAV